jgi:hypothetical protein
MVTITLTDELADLLFEIIQIENEDAAEATTDSNNTPEEQAQVEQYLADTNAILAAIRGEA